MEKVKVLYFVDRMLRGGIQTFVLENWKHMDKNKVQVDFLLLDDGVTYELEDTLRKMGSNVFKLKGIWIKKPWDYVKYYKSLNKFFKQNNDYQVVHLHSSSKNFLVLALAKKYGVKVRIAHSHNIGFQTTSKIQIVCGNILKYFLRKYSTDYFACSELAGQWLFGKKEKVTVVKNAVDIDKFCYNREKSEKIKKQLGLTNNFVIGHAGRFTHQKNHEFLIQIFNEIYKMDNNARLLLVGSGELESEIRRQVEKLHLEDYVVFAGFQTDVSLYMQAMDSFVFPSEYEGLGLVLIEAQAAGLTCFTSKYVVPEEAKVSELLTFISLGEAPRIWAEEILKQKNSERKTPRSDIAQNGYDIYETAHFLQQYYIEKANS